MEHIYEPIWFEGPQLPDALVSEDRAEEDYVSSDEEMAGSSSDEEEDESKEEN